MIKIKVLMWLSLVTGASFLANADEVRHGEFVIQSEPKVWHQQQSKWLTPEQFWLDYAESQNGLTWGEWTDYPEYSQVKEHDLLLIKLSSGKCLMEFFHGYFRANLQALRFDH